MGKKPDEIEQDIRHQREHISRRMEDLQHRVQEDMQSVRDQASGRASGAFEDARVKVQDARHSLKMDNLKSMVEEHTVSSMAGALGMGVLLGVVSEGSKGGRNGRNGRGARASEPNRARTAGEEEGDSAGAGRDTSNGHAGIGGMLASMIGPAANTAQEELQDLVREGFSVVKEQLREVKEGKPSRSGDTESARSSSPEAARPRGVE